MQNKGLKNLIFVLMLSICAFAFVSFNNASAGVVAASETSADCYYLLDDTNNPYQANVAVGSISGLGDFSLEATNVELITKANDNYQIVGWQVVYKEQKIVDGEIVPVEDGDDLNTIALRKEFFNTSGLSELQKTITLSDADETEIEATLTFVLKNGYYVESLFKIDTVFEDIEVIPVFDHIYYQLQINSITEVAHHTNSISLDGNTLYYEEKLINNGINTYTNSYLKVGADSFYYGNLFEENGEFYTTHKTLTENAIDQKIDYACGAFRFNDSVNLRFNIDIDASDITNSTNIDVKGISRMANATTSLPLYDVSASQTEYYSIAQDANNYRTTSIGARLNIDNSANHINRLSLNYHRLYLFDINLGVDGVYNHGETADILGEISDLDNQIKSNSIKSNIMIHDFYSVVDFNNLIFLVKSANDNGARAFRINTLQSITKTTSSGTYTYYIFDNIDGSENTAATYASIDQNTTVNINYISVAYEISFEVVEYKTDNNYNTILSPITNNEIDSISLKRGAKLFSGTGEPTDGNGNNGDYYINNENHSIYYKSANTWSEHAKNAINIIGFNFVGFADSLTGDIKANINNEIDKTEPKDTTIYLCFQKIAYTVVLDNFNKMNIDGTNPIHSITFKKLSNGTTQTETLNSVGENAPLKESPASLSKIKLKLGDSISIVDQINAGFTVRYSLLSPTQVADLLNAGDTEKVENSYLLSFEFTSEIISQYANDSKITIYVYESQLQFKLTYTTKIYKKELTDYVMAGIDVKVTSSNPAYTVKKYDLYGVEIKAENNNTQANVSKIEVDGLRSQDVVTLTSVGKSYDGQSYVFNWFIQDKTTLSYFIDDQTGEFCHTELITANTEILVVYSEPDAEVMISLEEDFLSIPEFVNNLTVKVNGSTISFTEEGGNHISVGVGTVVNVMVFDLSFGYEFKGYKFNNGNLNAVTKNNFNHTTIMGPNEIVLIFERTTYQFYFSQYGAVVGGKELVGEYVKFGVETFAELNVDKTGVDVTKPEGYYVRRIKINNIDFDLVENNLEYRGFADTPIYKFNLTRDKFIEVVQGGVDELPIGSIKDGILEVYVELVYSIYLYDVVIDYRDMTGNPLNENVDKLSVQMVYDLNKEIKTISYNYTNHTIRFTEVVPYGAVTEIQFLEQFQTGIRYAGWQYTNGEAVEFENAEGYIKLGAVKSNLALLYLYNFVDYKIVLNYDRLQGAPSIEINNENVNLATHSFHIFDSIKLLANAITYNGYKFDYLSYKNENNEEQIYAGKGGEFIISKFIPSNYLISDNRVLLVTINYDVIKVTLNNTIIDKNDTLAKSDGYTFELSNLASLEFVAVKNGQSRIVEAGGEIDFFEVVKIYLSVNRNAINLRDGKSYDLSLGVKLVSAQVAGKLVSIQTQENGSDLNQGVYLVTFLVQSLVQEQELMNVETLDIIFTLETQVKNVTTTTVIQNSRQFYRNNNITMYIQSTRHYGNLISIANRPKLNSEWQFLAPIEAYSLLSTSYNKFFRISGARIYLTTYDALSKEYIEVGSEISPDEYAEYGIELVEEARKGSDITDYRVKIACLLYNFKVVFKIQPIISYNGGPHYTKEFVWDETGSAVQQSLSKGALNSDEIQIAEEIADCLTVSYQAIKNGVLVDTPLDYFINAGEYKVNLSFVSNGDYDWLEEVDIAEDVKLTVNPKKISLIYDSALVEQNRVSKVYNKSSSFDVSVVFKYFKYTDGNYAINYDSLGHNLRLDDTISCYISKDGKNGKTSQANEELYYNLYVFNLALQDTEFNDNFILINNDIIINKYVKITRLEVELTGVKVNSKVFDNSDAAQLVSPEFITLSKKVEGDDVVISIQNMVVKFNSATVGRDKTVNIDASQALNGSDAGNYKIKPITIPGLTIYPYSISAKVDGIGTVSLVNKRGLTEEEYIDLIPLNATLHIEPILADSVEYAHIYSKIAKYVNGASEFSIGYTVSMSVNGVKKEIDNHLYLSVPKVNNITGTYFLTGEQTGSTDYKHEDGKVFIDLEKVKSNINTIFVTQKRVYLQVWQIVIIVVMAVAVVAGVIIAFVMIRIRKAREYGVHDKI